MLQFFDYIVLNPRLKNLYIKAYVFHFYVVTNMKKGVHVVQRGVFFWQKGSEMLVWQI